MMTLTGMLKIRVKTTRCIILKNGLRYYAMFGIVPSSLFIPSLLLRRAGSITGAYYNNHKLQSYHEAIRDLEAWITRHGGTY
jgi:hypothetical protein